MYIYANMIIAKKAHVLGRRGAGAADTSAAGVGVGVLDVVVSTVLSTGKTLDAAIMSKIGGC